MAQAFDTSYRSNSFNVFVKSFIDLYEGYIVAAACKDDCMKSMSKTGLGWFEFLGSKQIWEMKYRHGYAFIAKAGKPEPIPNEKLSRKQEDKVFVTQVFTI